MGDESWKSTDSVFEIEEGWKNCPYCGIQISDVEEAVERPADTEEETEKDLLFVKALFKAHPVRAVLCIPIILYVIIRLLGIEIYSVFLRGICLCAGNISHIWAY